MIRTDAIIINIFPGYHGKSVAPILDLFASFEVPRNHCYAKFSCLQSFSFLAQNSRQSISNHPNNADTSIVTEQLLRERDRAEERFAKIKDELTEAAQREADLRSHLGKKEKEVALVKHELKEAQRKAEQEAESRKKAETERAEIRRKLEDETNRRTKEQNNHIQV